MGLSGDSVLNIQKQDMFIDTNNTNFSFKNS